MQCKFASTCFFICFVVLSTPAYAKRVAKPSSYEIDFTSEDSAITFKVGSTVEIKTNVNIPDAPSRTGKVIQQRDDGKYDVQFGDGEDAKVKTMKGAWLKLISAPEEGAIEDAVDTEDVETKDEVDIEEVDETKDEMDTEDVESGSGSGVPTQVEDTEELGSESGDVEDTEELASGSGSGEVEDTEEVGSESGEVEDTEEVGSGSGEVEDTEELGSGEVEDTEELGSGSGAGVEEDVCAQENEKCGLGGATCCGGLMCYEETACVVATAPEMDTEEVEDDGANTMEGDEDEA